MHEDFEENEKEEAQEEEEQPLPTQGVVVGRVQRHSLGGLFAAARRQTVLTSEVEEACEVSRAQDVDSVHLEQGSADASSCRARPACAPGELLVPSPGQCLRPPPLTADAGDDRSVTTAIADAALRKSRQLLESLSQLGLEEDAVRRVLSPDGSLAGEACRADPPQGAEMRDCTPPCSDVCNPTDASAKTGTELADEVRRLQSRVSELESMLMSGTATTGGKEGRRPSRPELGSEASTGLRSSRRSSRSSSPTLTTRLGSSSSSSVCGVSSRELRQLREALVDALPLTGRPRESWCTTRSEHSSPVRRLRRAASVGGLTQDSISAIRVRSIHRLPTTAALVPIDGAGAVPLTPAAVAYLPVRAHRRALFVAGVGVYPAPRVVAAGPSPRALPWPVLPQPH